VLGYSAIKAGLSYLPLAVSIILSAGIASSLVTKVGFKPILAAAVAPSLIAESKAEVATRHFDVAGALTITLGLSAFVFALLDAESAGWGSAQTIGTLVAAALLLGAFVVIERRSRAPLVPFSIFRIRTITGANVVGILVGASLFSMFFFISLYMQQVLGYSPIKAGLSYLPLAVSIILSAGIASQLVTKVGFKPILATGMGLIALGLIWFSQISVDGTFLADILGPSLFAAVGLGFAFVPVTIAAVSGVEDREQGLASGLINTSQQVGGALGLAILAAIANGIINGSHDPGKLTEGFQAAFLAGAGLAVLGLIATLLLIRTADSKAHVELGSEPVTESTP
jgi:predicted MFS family arabinose efflux permease